MTANQIKVNKIECLGNEQNHKSFCFSDFSLDLENNNEVTNNQITSISVSYTINNCPSNSHAI